MHILTTGIHRVANEKVCYREYLTIDSAYGLQIEVNRVYSVPVILGVPKALYSSQIFLAGQSVAPAGSYVPRGIQGEHFIFFIYGRRSSFFRGPFITAISDS